MDENTRELIESLASELGVASEFIFEALVERKIAESIAGICLSSVFLIASVIVFFVLLRKVKAYESFEMMIDEFHNVFIFPCFMATILVLGLNIANIKDHAIDLLSPEAAVLIDLLRLLQ